MEFSHNPVKIKNGSGRWFMVVSQIDGGYLARDEVTSDLVYMKHSDLAENESEEDGR